MTVAMYTPQANGPGDSEGARADVSIWLLPDAHPGKLFTTPIRVGD
jgi:hypothetical protein